MSTTPPDQGPPIPPGYKPGDYIPFTDRDPSNPSSIAGQWADPARQAQMHGEQGGRPLTPQEHYRAIYGDDAPERIEFASWGRRVLGYLVDSFVSAVAAIPFYIGYSMIAQDLGERFLTSEVERQLEAAGGPVATNPDVSSTGIALTLVGLAIVFAFNIYNLVIRQGRTGYSLGKTAVGIRLVKASTGQPMGAGLCFVRQLAHCIDSLVCYLGWLWPLWDSRNQTIADKIMNTVVVIQPADSAP